MYGPQEIRKFEEAAYEFVSDGSGIDGIFEQFEREAAGEEGQRCLQKSRKRARLCNRMRGRFLEREARMRRARPAAALADGGLPYLSGIKRRAGAYLACGRVRRQGGGRERQLGCGK